MASKKSAPPNAVYQLKITLRGVRPPIWRRVLVGDTVTLHQLHRVFQAALGWQDTRLHRFTVAEEFYGEPSTEGFYRVRDERKATLAEVAPAAKTKFRYEYDLSDEWVHDVEVEAILPVTPDQPLPHCIAGKRACPPEGIGGAWGYGALLEAMQNPRHPERTRFARLIETFKPEACDLAAINQRLGKLKLRRSHLPPRSTGHASALIPPAVDPARRRRPPDRRRALPPGRPGAAQAAGAKPPAASLHGAPPARPHHRIQPVGQRGHIRRQHRGVERGGRVRRH